MPDLFLNEIMGMTGMKNFSLFLIMLYITVYSDYGYEKEKV